MSGPYDDAAGQMEFVYCVVTLWVLCPNFSEVLWNVKGDKQKGWWPLHTRLCDAGAVDGTAAGSLEPFVPTVCPHQAGDTGTQQLCATAFWGSKLFLSISTTSLLYATCFLKVALTREREV